MNDRPPRPDLPPATSLLGLTAIVATAGVVVMLIGLGLALRTVHSPIQDCGTVAGFLLDGRSDRLVDPSDPDDGITRSAAEAAIRRGCHERVTDAAKAPGVLMAGGLVVAVLGAGTEVVDRSWRRHRRRHPRARRRPRPPVSPSS
jgi:hypothetical protein